MSKSNNIPSSKLHRARIAGLTSAKLGLTQLAYKSRKAYSADHKKDALKAKRDVQLGKTLIAAFTQLRGTALKVAQMLSMELDFLPESVRQELSDACHKVTPLNRAHIRKVFAGEFKQAPDSLFAHFDHQAFAAASLGQVHRADTAEGKVLAIKIQYPGIAATIKSDLQLIRGLLKPMSLSQSFPDWAVINSALENIEVRLSEEVDYIKEANNTRWFADKLKVNNVRCAVVNHQYSGEKVLTTDYIDGLHVDQWLQFQPTQKQRNHFGQLLFDVFFHQVFELHRLHADPHMGNYLICENGELALIDFGCVQDLDEDFVRTVGGLFSADSKVVYTTYKKLGVIDDSMSYEQFIKEFFVVLKPLQNWLSSPFQQDRYDFAKMPSIPSSNMNSLFQVSKNIKGFHQHQMYFDRALFGLLSILRTIGAEVDVGALRQRIPNAPL